jgi:hypothetical protein
MKPRHRTALRECERRLGAVQRSLANRMRDFYTRDRTPRGPKRLEAKRYEGNVKEGNLLIAVHTDDSTERARAKDICMRAGAEDISYTEEARVSVSQHLSETSCCCVSHEF